MPLRSYSVFRTSYTPTPTLELSSLLSALEHPSCSCDIIVSRLTLLALLCLTTLHLPRTTTTLPTLSYNHPSPRPDTFSCFTLLLSSDRYGARSCIPLPEISAFTVPEVSALLDSLTRTLTHPQQEMAAALMDLSV